MALVEAKDFVYSGGCSRLQGYHAPVFTDLFLVSRILEFAIPFVALASFAVLAPVETRAKRGAFALFLVNLDVLVECDILLDVLKV